MSSLLKNVPAKGSRLVEPFGRAVGESVTAEFLTTAYANTSTRRRELTFEAA
jgi:hypothetical protein